MDRSIREANHLEAEAEREAERLKREEAAHAAQRLRDRNAATKEKAESEGVEDFLYKDETGELLSALTPEQQRQEKARREAETKLNHERKAAEFEREHTLRKRDKAKDLLLSEHDREKKQEQLEQLQNSFEYHKQYLSENPKAAEKAENKQAIEQYQKDIAAIQDTLAADDGHRSEYESLDKAYRSINNFVKGRPKILDTVPEEVPVDPERRAQFIQDYVKQQESFNNKMKALQTAHEENGAAYKNRIDELTNSYSEWRAGGGTPEQIAEAENNYAKAVAEERARYLSSFYDSYRISSWNEFT